MTTHPKPFVFFGSLVLYFFFFFFCPSVFICVFPVSRWTFHQTSTGLPLNTPKKNSPRTRMLVRMSEERVKCPQKSFFIWTCASIFVSPQVLFSLFFSQWQSEWVSEARSDWRLWDKGERERQRDEPGYEEDTDSAWASTNRIMHLTTM